MSSLLHLALALGLAPSVLGMERVEKVAKVGRMFSFQLHSANFFPRPAKVRWDAGVEGRPWLPDWLSLVSSPFAQISYLYGTPSFDANDTTIVVMGTNEETFEVVRKSLHIAVKHDRKLSVPNVQVAQLWVRNHDIWEFLTQPGLLNKLEEAVKKAFRGKGVRPYVYRLKPATEIGASVPLEGDKVGVGVFVGTRKGFRPGVINLAKGLAVNPDQCHRSDIIPLHRKFVDADFDVNWCKFQLVGVSSGKAVGEAGWEEPNEEGAELRDEKELASRLPTDKVSTAGLFPFPVFAQDKWKAFDDKENQGQVGVSSGKAVGEAGWEEPNEEGAELRDEKELASRLPTDKVSTAGLFPFPVFAQDKWKAFDDKENQGQDYMTLKRGQAQLREMSVQRQSLIAAVEDERTPQPGARGFSATASPSAHGLSPVKERAKSVGKQTVGEAAEDNPTSLSALYTKDDTESESDADTVINASEQRDSMSTSQCLD